MKKLGKVHSLLHNLSSKKKIANIRKVKRSKVGKFTYTAIWS